MSDRLGERERGERERGEGRRWERMGGEGREDEERGGAGREERRWVGRKGEGGEETMLEWTQACTPGTHEQ